jgi:hypothetical protein
VSGQANAQSASETANDYYTLLKQKNYNSAAGYYDPVALSEFRQLMSFVNAIPDAKRQVFFQVFFEPDLTDNSIRTLSDSDYFASFLRGVLGSEIFSESMNYDDVEILGEVVEGEDIAHVVTRNKYLFKDQDVESVEVSTFKKVDGEWRVQMSGKLKGIALAIRWDIVQ